MDIKNNKYKKIVGGISVDRNLGKILGQQIMQYDEDSSNIGSSHKKVPYFYNVIASVISSVILITALVFIILSIIYPITPKGVVRQYTYAIDNGDSGKADNYISSMFTGEHIDWGARESIAGTEFNQLHITESESIVSVLFEFPGGTSKEVIFKLSKDRGRWYIVSWE